MAIYFYMRIDSENEFDEKKYYRQEQILRKYAEKNEFTFIKDEGDGKNVFKENCSVDCYKRPEWDNLLRCLQTGDMVVFKDVSRFCNSAYRGLHEYLSLFEKGISLVFVENHTVDTDYILELANEVSDHWIIENKMSKDTIPLLVFAELKRVLAERDITQRKIRDGLDASDKRPGREKRGFEKLTLELESDILRHLKTGTPDRYELMLKHHVSKNTLSSYIASIDGKLRRAQWEEYYGRRDGDDIQGTNRKD